MKRWSIFYQVLYLCLVISLCINHYFIDCVKVCPTFSVSLIKRVLYNFVTDEFCPDPIPEAVLEALDYEVRIDALSYL